MSKLLPLCMLLLAASISVSAQTYKVIHALGSQPGDPGAILFGAAIAQSRGGLMFSTTPGSQHGIPAAFRIGPLGSIHILHQYGTVSQPVGGLTLARDGRFYGITLSGGPNKAGTVFRISQSGGITKLHDFTGGSDGAYPHAAPIQSVEGDFYLATGGGAFEDPHGSIQRMTTDGSMTLLHSFNGSSDGSNPFGPLVQGIDFRFYGVTQFGGSSDVGTIFRVSSTGDFEVLYHFDNTHGSMPQSGLIQANDGNFYGTTVQGGPTGNGVLFRVTPGGEFTVLHDFTGGTDGGGPVGILAQASDGNLYGTATGGGQLGYGAIFRATLSGVVTGVHSFGPEAGFFPSGVFQHTNGKLYGSTYFGGKFNQGLFYSLDADLPPFVTYLPTYGRAGGVVQILGQGFTNTSQVFFNGTPASFNLVYPTFIKATVPDAATTGPITVTTTNGTLTSNKVFIVHP